MILTLSVTCAERVDETAGFQKLTKKSSINSIKYWV